MVQASEGGGADGVQCKPGPLDFLYSSSDESSEDDAVVNQVRVADEGSQAHCARVLIQGVHAYGIIDSGVDITIMGGTLFKQVATAAQLRKRDFLAADKMPRTYDQYSFTLDGRMNLDLSLRDKTM